MEKENFGILTDDAQTSEKIINWFKNNGYDTNSWNGNATDGYYWVGTAKMVLSDAEGKPAKLYTWKEIEEMESFELPEQWCIISKNKEEDLLINKYARDCGGSHWTDFANYARAHYLHVRNGRYLYGKLQPEFKLLTIEQFKQHVLKQKEMKKYTIEELKNADIQILVTSDEESAKIGEAVGYNKANNKKYKSSSPNYPIIMWLTNHVAPSWNPGDYKEKSTTIKFSEIDFGEKIIGYKAPLAMPSIDIAKDEVVVLNKCGKLYRKNDSSSTFYGIAKELAETWEPSYEELIKSKEIHLGTPARKFTIFKDKVEVISGGGEKYTFTNEDVDSISSKFNEFVFKGLDCKVRSLDIGCADGLTINKHTTDKIKEIQQSL